MTCISFFVFLPASGGLLVSFSLLRRRFPSGDTLHRRFPTLRRLLGNRRISFFVFLPATGGLLGLLGGIEVLFEGFNGLVDELAAWRRVPAEPVSGVAIETVAIEAWRRFLGFSLVIMMVI